MRSSTGCASYGEGDLAFVRPVLKQQVQLFSRMVTKFFSQAGILFPGGPTLSKIWLQTMGVTTLHAGVAVRPVLLQPQLVKKMLAKAISKGSDAILQKLWRVDHLQEEFQSLWKAKWYGL